MRLVEGPTAEDAIRATARDWILILAEEPAREPECVAWRAADPAHEAAWRDTHRVWEQAAALSALDRGDWRAEIDAYGRPPAWRRHAPWAVAASAVLALSGTLYVRALPDFQAETRTAETRRLALADGSQVTLAAQSGVAVRYEEGSRRVMLDHGQAFFEVAHDRARPFTVVAGDAEIRVTGTKFDVRRVGDDIRVSVLEGRVELRRKPMLPMLGSARPDRVLTAGLRSELAPGAGHFSAATLSQIPAGDWRTGRLYYSEAPLSDIIADLQRYSSVPVRIDDPAVARLRVTTSFRVNQIKPFLDNLEAILPVRQSRAANGTILIEARDTAA